MIICRADSSDIKGIMDLLVQVNYVHYKERPDIFKRGTKQTPESLTKIFADNNNPVFVARDGEKTVAHCFCNIIQHKNDPILTDIKTLYIDDLCVDEAYRGKGVAQEVLGFVKNYAKEIGCYNITLNVWKINPRATAFYEHNGFVPLKTTMEQIL